MKRLLITICGRAGSKGFKNKNLKTFCGLPLVYYTLSAAQLFIQSRPDLTVDICLNTDSQLLADLVAKKYPEVVYLPRPEALGGDTVPKMAVFHDCLNRMEKRAGQKYDAVMDLDITSPPAHGPGYCQCGGPQGGAGGSGPGVQRNRGPAQPLL